MEAISFYTSERKHRKDNLSFICFLSC
uniref:Uncharacterized protein n=1 Tax=Arundo donax TaxID=35708 RepID=A0A0A9A3X1_ARUDO